MKACKTGAVTWGFAPPTGLEPVTTRKIEFASHHRPMSVESTLHLQEQAAAHPVNSQQRAVIRVENHV
jgi:hypothetical protein